MNATASGTVKDRRTVVIEVAIDIACPAEVVFGYCSDHTNEIEWNPAMRRVAKITDGPVGAGTWYEMEFLPGRPIAAECVRFDPPASWAVDGSGNGIRSSFTGRVTPVPAGARLELRMEIQTYGLLRAALPLLRRRMARDLARDIALIKARLEDPAEPRPPGSDPAAHGSQAALRAVKAIHTLAWFSIEACMAYVLYAGFARRTGPPRGHRRRCGRGRDADLRRERVPLPAHPGRRAAGRRAGLGHRHLPAPVVRPQPARHPRPADRPGRIPARQKPPCSEVVAMAVTEEGPAAHGMTTRVAGLRRYRRLGFLTVLLVLLGVVAVLMPGVYPIRLLRRREPPVAVPGVGIRRARPIGAEHRTLRGQRGRFILVGRVSRRRAAAGRHGNGGRDADLSRERHQGLHRDARHAVVPGQGPVPG